jgi:hypothetical protein
MFTLPETEQEVFDKVASHLLKQNMKSLDGDDPDLPFDDEWAMYRIEFFVDGKLIKLQCAAGCLIPDEQYDESVMEGSYWRELVDCGLAPDKHVLLIEELQKLHDRLPVGEWRPGLLLIARTFGLSPAVVENFLGEVPNPGDVFETF